MGISFGNVAQSFGVRGVSASTGTIISATIPILLVIFAALRLKQPVTVRQWLAARRAEFGYRRLHVLLRREGHPVNKKRVQRLYREDRLMVRQRGGRKRALGTRRPIETPAVANHRWSLDFVADQFTGGRRFRILEVYDDCTRECLAVVADTSIGGRRVARELDAILAWRGKPATIVSDNGTELTSNAILEWADQHKVGWHYIAPGKP